LKFLALVLFWGLFCFWQIPSKQMCAEKTFGLANVWQSAEKTMMRRERAEFSQRQKVKRE